MARQDGTFNFSASLEPKVAGGLDARTECPLYSDLISGEKVDFYYAGIVVNVLADPDETKRGLYRLKQMPTTSAANWIKIAEGSGGSGGGVTVHSELTGLGYDASGHTGFQAALTAEELTDIDSIPNLRDNLNNFYLKTETYSQDEIDALISGGATGIFEIVDELPSTGEANKIYLVPNGETGDNTRDEYIWIAAETKFEKIGNTGIDISGVVTVEQYTISTTELTTEAVGSIPVGASLEGSKINEIIERMFFAEKFPTLTGPSVIFSSDLPALVENNTSADISFEASLDRGSINPQYSAESPYRSGPVNAYTFTGPELPASVPSTESPINQIVTEYLFDTLGIVSWTAAASYDAGVQPKSTKGNDFNTPLVAGTTTTKTVSTTVVNPIFANAVSIEAIAKQSLVAPNVTYIEITFAEEDDTNKQTLQYGQEMGALTKIEQLNTLSGNWEAIDSATFTSSSIDIDVNGVSQSYYQLVHNGGKIGSRSIRFFV